MIGTYDFKLEATAPRRNREPDAADITIFTAVQEQLGLRLDRQRATIQVLTVEHIEKPSAN